MKLKLQEYLKDILAQGYDGWNNYEAGVYSFIKSLIEVVNDNIECDLDSLSSDDILSEWSEESGINDNVLESWIFRESSEYYAGCDDYSTGRRHVAEMMAVAMRQYQEMHNGELLVNVQDFVEGVLECFISIDSAQESLYDEVDDICTSLELDPDDFYDYFDIYSNRGRETYDSVDEELIEKLAKHSGQPKRGYVSDGCCYSSDGYCYSGDPDDGGVY